MELIFSKDVFFLDLKPEGDEMLFIVAIGLIAPQFFDFNCAHEGDRFFVSFYVIAELLALGVILLIPDLENAIPGSPDPDELDEFRTINLHLFNVLELAEVQGPFFRVLVLVGNRETLPFPRRQVCQLVSRA